MIFLCCIWMILPAALSRGLSEEKDMNILKAVLKQTGMTASSYIRELIRTGGNIDTSYHEDRAKAIRIIAGIANNINQTVKHGNSQGRLCYSDIDKL